MAATSPLDDTSRVFTPAERQLVADYADIHPSKVEGVEALVLLKLADISRVEGCTRADMAHVDVEVLKRMSVPKAEADREHVNRAIDEAEIPF